MCVCIYVCKGIFVFRHPFHYLDISTIARWKGRISGSQTTVRHSRSKCTTTTIQKIQNKTVAASDIPGTTYYKYLLYMHAHTYPTREKTAQHDNQGYHRCTSLYIVVHRCTSYVREIGTTRRPESVIKLCGRVAANISLDYLGGGGLNPSLTSGGSNYVRPPPPPKHLRKVGSDQITQFPHLLQYLVHRFEDRSNKRHC